MHNKNQTYSLQLKYKTRLKPNREMHQLVHKVPV